MTGGWLKRSGKFETTLNRFGTWSVLSSVSTVKALALQMAFERDVHELELQPLQGEFTRDCTNAGREAILIKDSKQFDYLF